MFFGKFICLSVYLFVFEIIPKVMDGSFCKYLCGNAFSKNVYHNIIIHVYKILVHAIIKITLFGYELHKNVTLLSKGNYENKLVRLGRRLKIKEGCTR